MISSQYLAELALFAVLVAVFVNYSPPTPAAPAATCPSSHTLASNATLDCFNLPLPKPLTPPQGARGGGAIQIDPIYEWASRDAKIDAAAIARGVEIYDGVEVRGARAARRIAAGETFLRLNIDQVFSLASVNRDPVLGSSIGRGSEYFEEVLPRAIEAQSMSLNFNDEYILSLAILYHISLGSQSSYWGYMTELLNADVSGQGIYLSWEEVGSRFPDFDEDAWSSEQEEWEEMYFVIGRRTRKHLERNFPDLWGPHVTVRGMPILSMENQVWASQIFYSRYWSNTEASHKDLSGLSGLSGPPQVGQRCKAKFKGDGKYYPGVIGELNEDGTFRVNFDDGDVDKKVELKDISEDDGSENGHAFLLPFADSLNYGLSCITCDFSHQDEEEGPIFACWAECDVEAGEALVWEYSSTTCKEQSLRAWGMATPNMKKC